MANQISNCFFLLVLFKIASAAINYPVYYDPSTNSALNPRGSGYIPQKPSNWATVDSGAWPIFLDWGKYLLNTKDWDKGNQCQDRSSSSYSTSHKQSPLKLGSDKTCTDHHKMIIIDRGQCQQSQAKFYTSPYGLAVDVTSCSKPFRLDHSIDKDPWYLREIVLKTPAEHSFDNSGNEKTFVGELQLAFRGSDENTADGSHERNIAITGVLLEVSTSSSYYDVELEKLIIGWETYQSQQYSACKVTYNNSTCTTQSTRRLRRELEQDDFESLSLPSEQEQQRNLLSSTWDQTCSNSFYCFINLYLHTETNYYYNYEGSLTYPPCTENVAWRVMQKTMKISQGQLNRIERLTYKHLDSNCKLATVGKKRGSSLCPCCVDVNRPRQKLSDSHNLKKCDYWTPEALVGNNTASTFSNGLF